MDCIRGEIVHRSNYLADEVETIYFGGGTPSIIDSQEIKKTLEAVYNNFHVAQDPEITLEANPEDISQEKLLQWKAAGINRLSIGIQSFQQQDLIWMNRAHSATQAIECIELARLQGFENISCDLIYGTPVLSDEMWKDNLDRIASMNVAHLSAYALSVESKTALQKMIEKHKVNDIDLQKQAQQFDLLMSWARENHFEHYEISNFAKKGRRSRHNSSYWQGKHYLGAGPSAHSFNGDTRQWNVANNALYIRSLQNGQLSYDEEILSEENKLNEYIMISLRRIEGLDLQKVQIVFGMDNRVRLERLSKRYTDAKTLICEGDRLILTDSGRHYADGIAAALFV